MFSPAAKRPNFSSRKGRNLGQPVPGSPATPITENRGSLNENSIPNRPHTGTPAPWTSRLSVYARIPQLRKSEKGEETDPVQPVYVGEFPQVVRDEQASFLQKCVPADASIFGGMDKGTSLSWIICGNKLFIWSYLTSAASKKCVVLELPSDENGDVSRNNYHATSWLLCFVDWHGTFRSMGRQQCNSAGVVLCNQKTRTVVYWPDIYAQGEVVPAVSFAASHGSEFSPGNGKITPNKLWQQSRHGSNSIGSSSFNSLIASAVPDTQNMCIALASSSNGELWQFQCSPTGIHHKQIYQENLGSSSQNYDSGNSNAIRSKGYPKSLTWRHSSLPLEKSKREFFLLTDNEIQCFSVDFFPDLNVVKLWSHEIIGTDGDLGIKKDLAGQKRIWPLDLQVDVHGKVITILVATFCKDRVSSSSYTQYSLLTMQYKSGISISESIEPIDGTVLEKKSPLQVIIPKARVEKEDFLFSLKLRVGGKPSGSAVILSEDGTATVSHYYGNSTRLYQFDLPYDAGKVLDASIFPSTDDGEDGAWVVLTEKAGIWAIPEKAVLLGGVEPPERSLSRKGSSNEVSAQEERRNLAFTSDIAPRRASSEAWNTGDRQRTALTGVARRTARDEESEALLGHLFHDFLLTGQVDDSLEKLRNCGAFERDGETNVFARISKSIVDTLAKHWTTTRGAEIVAMAVVSTQLSDKQQKHKKFLQFLALSRCHEELCSKQRESLQIIMEHGEKLVGMIQLRELQNVISQNRLSGAGSPYSSSESGSSGSLWDLIQLVGERTRRNTVLLMDRDNAEVFFSKVSDMEEVFYCLDRQLEYLVNAELPLMVQIQRACELSNACVVLIQAVMHYRDENHIWYPLPEGLTPWYCQPVVRNGQWSVASFMLQLLSDRTGLDMSVKSDIYSNLEALAEVLLEAYNGAITAKVERGEEHRGLLNEYWNRRDTLLNSLYQVVKGFVESGCQDSNEGIEEQKEVLLKKLSSSLLSIAKRHEEYLTLWNICCDLNDAVLLRSIMHESVGPKAGFSYFVFQQLYGSRQFSKLLRLGEEFQEELSIFLQEHLDLRWLHELFLHHFSSASETLHLLALSQDENSISSAEKGMDLYSGISGKKLVERSRLLNLSKIAAVAGKDADYEAKVNRIEADLRILKLQEEIIRLLPRDEVVEKGLEQKLLPPRDLVELCLKSGIPELSLLGFEVLAWTSSSFRKANRSLLEECWKCAANRDDWGKLYETSVAQGWSDEYTLRVLRETMLFQVSSRCYGPGAETIEGGFEEVLALRQENVEMPSLKESGSSVEAILMQHKDFPDAGKLMLTAVMMGAVGSDEGPSPME